MRIAINGFGRIGRLVFRQLITLPKFKVVAINDLVDASNLAYLLKYDSTHGASPHSITSNDHAIVVDNIEVPVISCRDPSELPWKDLSVDIVIEATGRFTHASDAKVHLDNGAKKVIITAPGKGEVPTFVMGVNHMLYNPKSDHILSNASCTTNCLAPIAKVLLDSFGIEEGLMTTVHAATATQPTVDGPSKKDFRGGRGALQNIIPSSTGAAKAVAQCIPELQGKLTGMAFRVPVANVSCVDLTVRLSQKTSYNDICRAIQVASEGTMRDILGYTEDPVVSSDFVGSTYSSIFDAGAGIALNDHFFKLISWYDNEMGYSSRIVDLIKYLALEH